MTSDATDLSKLPLRSTIAAVVEVHSVMIEVCSECVPNYQ